MTKKQFDDLYLGKAVHCDTEEKANEFLKLAHGVGYKWCNGESLLEDNYYQNDLEKTCYLVGSEGFEYSPEYFYIEEGYEVVEFKQEKENNMKFKVGDKVRVKVKSGLKKGQLLGITLDTYHRKLENNVFTIVGVTSGGNYDVEETRYILSDEMLEPVESYKVGDVVYTYGGEKVTLLDLTWLVKFGNGKEGFIRESQLSKTKPVKKITRKELALKGYELVD